MILRGLGAGLLIGYVIVIIATKGELLMFNHVLAIIGGLFVVKGG